MACKCNTSDRHWRSHINGQFEGFIEVGPEDLSTGDFDGRHHGHNQPIRGRCVGGMGFQMPATQPRFVYSGRFASSDCLMVIGKRVTVGPFGDVGASEVLTVDDWVATKGTTFTVTLEAPSGPGQEPSADKSADKSAGDDSPRE